MSIGGLQPASQWRRVEERNAQGVMMKTTTLMMTKKEMKQQTERRVLKGTAFIRGQNFSDTQGKRTRGVFALKGLSVVCRLGTYLGIIKHFALPLFSGWVFIV